MLHIRPISDLRNEYTEIPKTVEEDNEIELSLKKAELERVMTAQRFTHEEVFSELRERIALEQK